MPTVLLPVPHIPQTTDGTCLEACASMVLAYLQNPVPENQICQLFESTGFGTPASRILRLQKWGFHVEYGTTNLQELRNWLKQGVPPIAFVHTRFLDYWTESTPHAVVVIGMDEVAAQIER